MALATGDAANGTGNRLDGRMEEAVYRGAYKEFHIRGREDVRLIE